MKRSPKYQLSKAEIIKTLGLKRVMRMSDKKRVWVSIEGKEYESLSEAAKFMPKREKTK